MLGGWILAGTAKGSKVAKGRNGGKGSKAVQQKGSKHKQRNRTTVI